MPEILLRLLYSIEYIRPVIYTEFIQCLTKPRSKLSHFQFAERFYVNTIYREQFHESIWRQLEKHLSS